jgi:hypothetical protein
MSPEATVLPVVLAATILTLAALGGLVWYLRARAARRFQATLDAYAEREIMQAERRRLPTALDLGLDSFRTLKR